VYLVVTSDQTLAYKEHLSYSAVKLKRRSNLITKLAGTSWGASASTICTSALTLCYSVAEYCCPVWARYSYINHSSMCMISGCLQPTQLSWLPVLRNIAPPSLRHKVYGSKHRSPSKLAYVCWRLWASTSMACISMLNMVWYVICQHNYAVERGLASVVNHTIVTDPSMRQPGFNLPLHIWSLMDRSRPMSC